ncbi:pilus assembly protein PilM, partial [Patescibacteria group bacterium]|nr:pilus assembly protein PilM [Patescibacteria group bacterium]
MKVFDFDNLISNEKIFGVEIRDNLVKVLEVKRIRGKYSVTGYGKQEIDQKAIENDIITDENDVAAAIKLAREQASPRKIKAKYASVVLPDSKIFIRIVAFPAKMTKDEIRDAIEWKAKDLIAMPLEKVYWDWHRLTEDEEDVEQVEVVISAVEKECADSYTRTMALLNITPIFYDISGNAAARFLFQKKCKNKRALLVRIDRNSTTLSLFLSGGVRYQTQIKDLVRGGYSTLVDLTASKLKVGKEEAEKLILSPSNLNDEQKTLLQGTFEVNYEALYQEIRNILDYYSQNLQKNEQGSKEEISFSGIYIYGSGARLFHLKNFLENKEVKIKDKADTKSEVSPMLPFISRESLPENLVILGLSLRNLGLFRDLRDINLVPDKIQSKYLQVSIYNSLYAYLKIVFWSIYIIGIVLIFAYVMTLFY